MLSIQKRRVLSINRGLRRNVEQHARGMKACETYRERTCSQEASGRLSVQPTETEEDQKENTRPNAMVQPQAEGKTKRDLRKFLTLRRSQV